MPSKTVTIRVKPSSKKGSFVQAGLMGDLVVYVREPAVEGRANAAAVELLADYFNVPKSQIRIVRGLTSRVKVVDIGFD